MEMRIPALQRIEGPRHLVKSHRHRALPLRLLQPRAEIQMPVRTEHRQQVRMDRRLPMFPSQKPERKPDQLVLIECPHKNVARSLVGNGQRERHAVLIGHSPHFLLHGLQLAEIVDVPQIADDNLWSHVCGHHGRLFSVARPGVYQRLAAASSRSISRRRFSERRDWTCAQATSSAFSAASSATYDPLKLGLVTEITQ